MKIQWLPEANRNRISQIAYIAERAPAAATCMGDQIVKSLVRVADFPEIERPGRVPGTRELPVLGTPFVLIYRIELDTIVIVRMLHGRQRWPLDEN